MARAWLVTPFALLLACSRTGVPVDERPDATATAEDTDGDAGAGEAGTSDLTTADADGGPEVSTAWSTPDATLDDAPRAAVCPATPPVAGTPCTPYDTWESYCTYGTEVLSDCRTIFRCREGDPTWVEVPRCHMVTDCPPQPAARKACGVDRGRCAYADGEHCVCTGLDGYHCARPALGCPLVPPNAGTLCETEGLVCDYSVDEECCDHGNTGYRADCKRGVWSWRFLYGGP